MDVTEGSRPTCPDTGWSLHHDVASPHSHIELIVLQPPPPVLVAHTVHLLVAVSGDQQNASDEGRVVVLGVELMRGDVVGVVLRVFVLNCWVDG